MKKPVTLRTAFDTYETTKVIGQGGGGRVFEATDSSGRVVAIKLLTGVSSKSRRRFKNETAFLRRIQHRNIVEFEDMGFLSEKTLSGPFYVMRRYSGSFREVLGEDLPADKKLELFCQILDGVEAAHFYDVVHRDLKPENILHDEKTGVVAVADFGIASIPKKAQETEISTNAADRMANFQYAAPEQRTKNGDTSKATDIYALGLMLNEMFTGQIIQGEDYAKIAEYFPNESYLDDVVSAMVKQKASVRPQTIAEVKRLIARYRREFVNFQKLSQLDDTILPEGEINEPLALKPVSVSDASYEDGKLSITLSTSVNKLWRSHLSMIGNFKYSGSVHPHYTTIVDDKILVVSVRGSDAQNAIEIVKSWLPEVTKRLYAFLQEQNAQEKYELDKRLEADRARQEENLKVNSGLKI